MSIVKLVFCCIVELLCVFEVKHALVSHGAYRPCICLCICMCMYVLVLDVEFA